MILGVGQSRFREHLIGQNLAFSYQTKAIKKKELHTLNVSFPNLRNTLEYSKRPGSKQKMWTTICKTQIVTVCCCTQKRLYHFSVYVSHGVYSVPENSYYHLNQCSPCSFSALLFFLSLRTDM